MRALHALLALSLMWVACDDDAGSDPAVDGSPGDATVGSDAGGADAEPGQSDAGEPDTGGPLTPAEQLLAVEETEAWTLPGLNATVHVVRTEAGVPNIYAEDRLDLGRTLGFVVARDRYFVMDLQRRLALGTLSELLGADALENDFEARSLGITYVADRLLENLSPDMSVYLQAVSEGINAYIDEVDAGNLPPPSELELAKAFLGADRAVDLMKPWDVRDLAAMVAVILYETNYETDDLGTTRARARLDELFPEGTPFAELRRAGYLDDVWNDVSPLFEAPSSAGLGVETADGLQGAEKRGRRAADGRWLPRPTHDLAPALLERLHTRLQRFSVRMNRDKTAGFGSNAWAVSADASASGGALLAGDGHLQLSVPALMYQIGLDTEVLGGGGLQQKGLLLTSLPVLAVGTNGKVAWCQVNPVVDITDWYREEIQLDENGKPSASFFQGEWRPLVAVEETYVVADVPLLGSEGREETWTRWTTFDGRFLAEIEGRPATEEDAPGDIVLMSGNRVVPGDMDDDGVVSGISFDHGAFDATGWVDALDGHGLAEDVEGLREATKGVVGGGLFTAAADMNGDVLFSSYQAIPCRGYLDRDAQGRWLPGADPTMLLDGTVYGGFTLPTTNGIIDENSDDPYHCLVPFDRMPQAITPAPGYVYTANNDPGGLTLDGRLDDDDWYLGGPWSSVRADTIRRELARQVEAGEADLEGMEALQANITSRMGELFAPHLVDAIEIAAEAGGAADAPEHLQRLAAIYATDADAFEAVAQRLRRWAELAYHTPSGVETFYDQPGEDDLEAAVATMIFNAWFGRALRGVFADEGLDGAWRSSSSRLQVRSLRRFLEGRGEGNPSDLASHLDETGESVFFDRADTEEVERSHEILLAALAEALVFLRSEPEGPGEGGFGTDDMDAWLWGLRHQTRFESLLGDFLGDDPAFASLLTPFSITTRKLPLADDLDDDDPRDGLKWFPRGGDQWAVDAANPGFSGTRFTHGNGPVMRMVIELKEGRVSGKNIVPGGQSALTDSPHFADQAALWLGNEALPLRYHPEEVAEGATGREVYSP